MFRHLITTQARPSICPRCRQAIIIGVSEGLTTRVDPHQASRSDQALAIVTGRGVYILINRTLIARVDPLCRWPMLIEHRCGRPIGTLGSPPAVLGDQPPF